MIFFRGRKNSRQEPTLQQLANSFFVKEIDWVPAIEAPNSKTELSNVVRLGAPGISIPGALYVHMSALSSKFNENGVPGEYSRMKEETAHQHLMGKRKEAIQNAVRAVEALTENVSPPAARLTTLVENIEKGETALGEYADWVRKLPTVNDEEVIIKANINPPESIAQSVDTLQAAFREVREKAQAQSQHVQR